MQVAVGCRDVETTSPLDLLEWKDFRLKLNIFKWRWTRLKSYDESVLQPQDVGRGFRKNQNKQNAI